ncbi:MAG: HAMP domain-containing protein, partial [Desulfovibrio sp.]
GDPVFYVYVQSMTVAAQQRKTAVTWLFVFGSAVVVLLTSLALIILTRSMVTRPLSALAVSAERLAQGKLDEPIDTSRNDELGGLARNFLNMRDAVSQTIGELELSNQELNQERMRLQAMVKALPDLILVVDDSGVCLEAMASGDEALLATPVSMMKGTPMTSIFPREAGEACLSLVRSTIETGKTMSLVFRVVGPRGPRWLEGRSSRISLRGDEPGTAIWISRDITESKRLEDSLRVAKEEAELANAQLRRLDDLKSAFLASVSHELRTPLTSFLGFAKLIAKNFHRHFRGQVEENSLLAKKADQIEDNLAIMAQEGDRLTRLINDVLDLNRISSGHMSWHDQIVAPHHAAAMAADSVSGMFEDKADVELMVHVPTDLPQLKIDPDRLLQVIINLLNNAAKFTHSGAVTLKAKLVDQGWLAFTVEDTGEGIPEHEALAIFDKFHQVERSDTLAANRKGAGLGLPICKEIVEHYGGKIWVESVAGQGSAFTFTLPVTPS